MKVSIAHIINPVKIGPPSDLVTAQPITFESMRIAKDWIGDKIDLSLFTVSYAEDHEIIPEYFSKLPDLEKSVLDINSFEGSQRKLPLIKDIMDALYHNSDAEYLVYTNADIALMPYFYEYVAQKINEGHDALVINRRRISKDYTKLEELPKIFAELGEPHPGYDCFVIHRELYPKFILGNICVGIPFIGVSLAHNIFSFATNFQLIDKEHLTVHIGKRIFGSYDNDYYRHNFAEFKKVKEKLKPYFKKDKFPYAELPFFTRMIKWGLNPSLSIRLFFELESEGWKERFQEILEDIRLRIVSR